MSSFRFLSQPITSPLYFPPATSWLQHGPFAMWLVRAMEPKRIVELGTHWGYSYFCFCQAVADAKLPTECFAIDTWLGDEHSGFYDESVYEAVTEHNSRYSEFSTLVRKEFSNALGDFDDGSVDLLHVDGRHFYDDVRADFESWLPKLSDKAVVLFHDTEVTERDFGVYRYWREIAPKRPSLNFPHDQGLGVLFWGNEIAPHLEPLAGLAKTEAGREMIVNYFHAATQTMALERELKDGRDHYLETAITRLQREIARQKLETDTRDSEIGFLKAILRGERQKPLRQLRRKYASKLLYLLAKAHPPLSSRQARKLLRSAAKRDPRRDVIVETSSAAVAQRDYAVLLKEWESQRTVSEAFRAGEVARLKSAPLISVVVPVFNPDPRLLGEMIESVRAQSYPNWELCLADDASTDPEVRQALERHAADDARIRLVLRETNGNISLATNSAIEIAKGSYVAFVDHDDLVDRDALLLVAKLINERPDAKIIYTDEDKVRDDGARFAPHFKPDWNRELLYGNNYVSHLGVYDMALVRDVGMLRTGFEGAQDYDLLLRCIERCGDDHIHHIPNVLYSWRATAGSTSVSAEAKPYASEAGSRALAEHLKRVYGRDIEVKPGAFPFSYKPLWPLQDTPLVTLIMPTRDNLDVLRVAVESILEKTAYRNFELTIVDNGSKASATIDFLEGIRSRDKRICILRDGRPFNYSALNNLAVQQSSGALIGLVNNDIEVIDEDWLTEMVSLSRRDDIGCVGAKLIYPDDHIQHAGVVIGIGGVAAHAFLRFPSEHGGYFGRLKLRQEYSAVTGACLLVRRSVYDEVGGLNETDLPVAFNDVDFCLKVKAAGYRNLWTPWARLYHHESVSRGQDDTPENQLRFEREINYMLGRWHTDKSADPAYNPNLTLDGTDFSYGPARWNTEVQ